MLKSETRKLIIDKVPRRFNEGLFWGNGVMGGLLYVKGSTIHIALDHVMLWETRDSYADTKDYPSGKFQDFYQNQKKYFNGDYFDKYEGEIYRTKLPGLALAIDFDSEIVEFYGETCLYSAVSVLKIGLKNGQKKEAKIYLDGNKNVLRIDTEQSITIKGWDIESKALSVLKKWNYGTYKIIEEDDVTHGIQPYSANGLGVISLLKKNGTSLVAFDADINKKEGMTASNGEHLRMYAAKLNDYEASHYKKWANFWDRFDLSIPNERLESAFFTEMYKIFCNESPTGLPVSLVGVFNYDERMPGWTGDFHNDLNVQSCYWAAYKTNNIELVRAYIEYYHSCMNRFVERGEKLFGIKNAIHVPLMMGLNGYGTLAEWNFWNTLIGPELFVATDFCWFYEFSQDKEMLANRIYPFVEKVLNLYIGIACKGEDNLWHIPFTNTPEVFRGHMILKEDSTFTISTLHYLLDKMDKYAKLLKVDNNKWTRFKKDLVPIKTTDRGLPLFPEDDLFESHRHFCQMFPVFPLGTETHSLLAEKSLDTIINKGYMGYASWSFPYLSIFASRVGRGNMARTALEIYAMSFRSPNTFTVNGDSYMNGLLEVSNYSAGESSDVFTLEAGFILPAAISEMFVHRTEKGVFIGYGLPDEWNKCSCVNFTIEGGHRVSVRVYDYKVKTVEIHANIDETINLFVKGYDKKFTVSLKKASESIIDLTTN